MPNKRYTYKVIINEKRKITKDKIFHYDFGSTKGIELAIFKEAASIQANMTVKYAAEEVISKDLFKDALLKALLLHLLKNNGNLDIKNLQVEVHDHKQSRSLIDECSYNSEDQPIVYSMIKGDLEHPIRQAWSHEEIENLLDIKKSHGDRREAALISFLYSKSRRFESERFLSLWMAFNGMYGHLAETAKNKGIEEYQKTSETKEIQLTQEFLGYPAGRVIANDSDKVMRCIKPIIVKFYKGDLSKTKLNKDNKDYGDLFLYIKEKLLELSDTLDKQNKYSNISPLEPYTYLLTQFTYAFRCDYFHASKPIPIFIHTDEADLICLQAMNDLLDEFLEDNLHFWFSDGGVYQIDKFIDGLAGQIG